jgi:8-oxo-dGTP diphosphatase
MLQFKTLPKGKSYIDRPGSYAIMTLEEQVVVMRIISWGEYFLPGGGIEEGEESLEALHREVIEETGFFISVLEKIGEAAEYVYSPGAKGYLNKIGQYYTVEITGQNKELIIEDDLEMVLMSREEAVKVLYLESQKWAIQQWIEKENNG